jgi:DNA-directed RNA polymerase subunit beta'
LEVKDFNALRISLASPEIIRDWSYGEVTKPETINYRRLRPEKDGLFCEAIFGPTRDWQCYCGKYKQIRYKGITCEKCGVLVTRSSVRRERMGHIELAAPVAHIWYTRRVPSYLGLLLDISRRNLDRVLYFAQYIIIRVDEQARARALKRLDDELARERSRVELGMLDKVDAIRGTLDEEISQLREAEETIVREMDEKQTKAIEEIMHSAQVLQQVLEQSRGQLAKEDLALPDSEEVIVSAGDTIAAEQLSTLNEMVDERLDEIKLELESELTRERAEIEKKIDQLRFSSEAEVERFETSGDSELDELVHKIDEQRQELLNIKPMQFLNELQYRELEERWGNIFEASMGAEALYEICKDLDLDKLVEELRTEIKTTRSKQKLKKAIRRLQVADSLRRSGNRPEWMILIVLPVIPPDLRPMVQLDGGRFATSDLNDLYRRVINRNNRLKRLLDLGAPDVIVRNEKRMLQEAVDSLIDNSCRGKAVSSRGRRELKSLSDMLKGKQGRFRRNLLGKRVDYSGRSVIVIGPELELHQAGIPKEMALELFRPFVIQKLVEYNYANNVKGAKRFLEQHRPEVWEVLEEVIQTRPVLLNRAPTLHRLGIQAFEPILVEGSAIHLHPLVCAAFNADFDGDQMAVHIPLSENAVREARELMLASKNLLLPANGEPIVGATKDMVLGIYYMTMEGEFDQKGAGKVFGSTEEVSLAYTLGKVDLHAPIKVKNVDSCIPPEKEPFIETTVGRVLFNEALPAEIRFAYNRPMDKGALKDLINLSFQRLGVEATAKVADDIKTIGFKYATLSGTTIAISDINIPATKQQIIDETSKQIEQVNRQFRRGLITADEQYIKTVELWTKANEDITREVGIAITEDSPIRIMADSGATKGGFTPIRQLAGMRGLMTDPSGRIIPLPIRSNFREGLTALEYFISTHGSRKGLADTALRTADAGYLTRRLVDVAQDVIVNATDCGSQGGISFTREAGEQLTEAFKNRVFGRILARDVVHPETGEVLFERNQLIQLEELEKLVEAKVTEIFVRSPLTCELDVGVCALCYGSDMARGGLARIGEAVGIIAAQSIGEPGTQLTLRTFHTGGVAGDPDITTGLPRITELFEARTPKSEALIADIDGIVEVISRDDGSRALKIVSSEMRRKVYKVPADWEVLVEDGTEIAPNTLLARSDNGELVAEKGGRVYIKGSKIGVSWEQRQEVELSVDSTARLRVGTGDQVVAGQQLSEGAINPHRLLEVMGREVVQRYLVDEVQEVYRAQGVPIHDKHVEIVIRQMTSKVQVSNARDSKYLPGEIVERRAFQKENEHLADEGKQRASARPILLGITRAALNTESFLSASSFQHTINVLAQAAIEGKTDNLRGLKENVIIGKLIPAGTGYDTRRRDEIEASEPAMISGNGDGAAEPTQDEVNGDATQFVADFSD